MSLLNVSYDPTRELYKDINRSFIADWKATKGTVGVRIMMNQSVSTDPRDPNDPSTYPAPTRYSVVLGDPSYHILNSTYGAFFKDADLIGVPYRVAVGPVIVPPCSSMKVS